MYCGSAAPDQLAVLDGYNVDVGEVCKRRATSQALAQALGRGHMTTRTRVLCVLQYKGVACSWPDRVFRVVTLRVRFERTAVMQMPVLPLV